MTILRTFRAISAALALAHTAFMYLSILAFGLRPAYGQDTGVYMRRAKQFASIDFLDFQTNWSYAPGYSAFLALTGWLTQYHHYLVAGVQALLFSWAIYELARRVVRAGWLTEGQALFGMGFVLLNPSQWQVSQMYLSEPLTASLFALAAAALAGCLSEGRPRDFLLLGLFNALLVMTRFEYVFVPVAQSAVLLLAYGKPALRRLPVVVGLTLLLLGLNGLRNAYIFGRFNPFSYGAGTVIYGGNNLKGDGSWHTEAWYETYVPERHHEALLKAWRASVESAEGYVAKDSVFRAMAAEAWRKDPGLQLRAIPLKVGKTWLYPPNFDVFTADKEYKRSVQLLEHFDVERWGTVGVAKHLAFVGLHWLWLAGGLTGLSFALRRKPTRLWGAYVLAAVVGVTVLFGTVFYGLPRFAAPVSATLFFCASFALPAFRKALQKSTTVAPQE